VKPTTIRYWGQHDTHIMFPNMAFSSSLLSQPHRHNSRRNPTTRKRRKKSWCILKAVAILVVFQATQTLQIIIRNNNDHATTANETTQQSASIRSTSPSSSPNAYVFMLWRCQPEQQQQQSAPPNNYDFDSYRGYLVNVCIASILLRRHGSTADILLVVQLSAKNSTTQSTLNSDELDLLKRSGVSLRYLLPKEESSSMSSSYNSFATMFHKFHIYSFVEYEKIFYLDSDILPLNNLDYMFDMMDGGDQSTTSAATSTSSTSTAVKAITIGGVFQPANGGFFLIRPNMTDYRQIRRMIEQRGATLGDKESFDPVYGWGHKIVPTDQWETNHPRTKGDLWNFVSKKSEYNTIQYNTMLLSC
jgi:alpha-N-acetylglucosamine transferase